MTTHAEKTVPATYNGNSLQNREEATREERRYLTPPVDIFETEEGLVLLADLPGIEKDQLNILVENGILTIEANAPVNETQDEGMIWREYQLRSFWRQFHLSDEVDQAKIDAQLKNGVLRLFLPKAEIVKPRQIEVKIA